MLSGGLVLVAADVKINEDNSAFDARRKRGDRGRFRSADGHAGFEIETPSVERADNRGAGHDAIAQRSAFVRTFVADRQTAIFQTKDRDLLSIHGYSPALVYRNVLDLGDGCPADFAHDA